MTHMEKYAAAVTAQKQPWYNRGWQTAGSIVDPFGIGRKALSTGGRVIGGGVQGMNREGFKGFMPGVRGVTDEIGQNAANRWSGIKSFGGQMAGAMDEAGKAIGGLAGQAARRVGGAVSSFGRHSVNTALDYGNSMGSWKNMYQGYANGGLSGMRQQMGANPAKQFSPGDISKGVGSMGKGLSNWVGNYNSRQSSPQYARRAMNAGGPVNQGNSGNIIGKMPGLAGHNLASTYGRNPAQGG